MTQTVMAEMASLEGSCSFGIPQRIRGCFGRKLGGGADMHTVVSLYSTGTAPEAQDQESKNQLASLAQRRNCQIKLF